MHRVNVARDRRLACGAVETVLGAVGELLAIRRIIRQNTMLAPVVDNGLARNVLDDCAVARGILDGEVDRRLDALVCHHYRLDALEQGQGFGDAFGIVENVLSPQRGLDAALVHIACAEVGHDQIEQVDRDALFVDAISRSRRHTQSSRDLRISMSKGQDWYPLSRRKKPAVTCHSARQERDQWFSRDGEIHGAADDHGEFVIVP